MKEWKTYPSTEALEGIVEVPGDKSIGHRALIFGALCEGEVRISGLTEGEDNMSTLRAMASMGTSIRKTKAGEVVVHGKGLDGLKPSEQAIDCGNSGTTMRLLSGLLVGQDFESTLIGDASLSKRPMRRIVDPLRSMGASIDGRIVEDALVAPLHIFPSKEGLRPISFSQKIASAQVKSALLLAGLYAKGTTEIIEPGPSRDHSERLLTAMGAPIEVVGGTIRLNTLGWNRVLSIPSIVVPSDPSAAVYFVVAGLITDVSRITVPEVGVNPRRTGFMDAIASWQGLVEEEAAHLNAGESIADLSVSRGAAHFLKGGEIAGEIMLRAIDELPILAICAACADGNTRFRDAQELRHKESDRIHSTLTMLRALGVEAEEHDDGLTIKGARGRRFNSCTIDSFGDHRIAMSAAIAGLGANGPITIRDVECVNTSFPNFEKAIRKIGGRIETSSKG